MKSANDVRQNSPLSATALHSRASIKPRPRLVQILIALKIASVVALLFVKYRIFVWREHRHDSQD